MLQKSGSPDTTSPLVLVIDVGSSSVRARLYDRQGRALPHVAAQEHYSLRVSTDGAAEDDADAALERVGRCADQALAQAGPLADAISGVALSTFVSNILPLDAAGRPLGPLITYADTRDADDAAELRQRLDEGEAHQRTGCMLRSSYWPGRLMWYRRVQPEVWAAAARWVPLSAYLEQRLFGQGRASFSVASWTGLLDRRRLTWDEPLLEAIGVASERLAPLADVSQPLQGLQQEYAERWPSLRAVPWFPAIGDGAAANIGSGCTDPSRVALTVGTTGALRVVRTDNPDVPKGLWCYRVDRRRSLLGGATSEGGSVYAWMQRVLKLDDPETVEQTLTRLPPDGHGLTMLPFLAGERSLGWSGDARATISGLSLATTPVQMLQAGLEAVAYRFALIYERICQTGEPPRHVVASGGALLNSPAWTQMVADVLGHPVVASAEPEATSRGVALLALEALGALPSITDAPASEGVTYTPDSARHAVYRAAIARQENLYQRLM